MVDLYEDLDPFFPVVPESDSETDDKEEHDKGEVSSGSRRHDFCRYSKVKLKFCHSFISFEGGHCSLKSISRVGGAETEGD